MGWIVLTVLLSILFWACMTMWLWAKHRDRDIAASGGTLRKDAMPAGLPLGAAVLVGLLWVAVSLFFMVRTVGQREVAIVYSFSGTITGKRNPGVVTIAPWQHIKKENVGIQHEEWVFDSDNAAVSKDQQKVFGRLAVNYQIEPGNVVDLYKRVGPSWKKIIVDSRVPQVFKEVTATYPTQLITANREQLRIDTRERLANELKPYDIKVIDVFVTNLGFSQTYTDAIEAKQKQVQDAQRAQAKVNQVKAEADQKVAEAVGEAKANIAVAKGEATANRLRQRSLTPLLVQQQAIEKLNPNVQVIVCPPKTVCIPNTDAVPVETGGK